MSHREAIEREIEIQISPRSGTGTFDSARSDLDPDALALAASSSGSASALPIKISRDEMNLAEFPLTVLSKRADPSVKTLEFSDVIKGKNGEPLNRKWIITGADKFGLPTSSDDEVLLGLLKLTADEGLQSRKVHFTRYELLRILRWSTEGRSYTRLQNALDRLSGVRIKATNAFYDNETKLHSTRNFGIIDAYEINDGRDTHPSFFTWSEVLFKSFQVGFIKKLDLEFYLDLQSAVSKRLYRYLDKHFWYRSRIQVNLFVLAHEKIGISRNYIYASSLRQQLEPALEELKEKGALSEYEFIGKGKSTEVVLVAAHAPRKVLAQQPSAPAPAAATSAAGQGRGVAESAQPSERVQQVISQLAARGLAEKQARRLVAGYAADALARIEAIISHFDRLVASQSHLVSRSPQGFLYRAVEKPFEFTLPGEKAAGKNSPQGALAFSSADTRQVRQEEALAKEKRKAESFNQEIAYLTERKEALESLQTKTDQSVVQELRAEVEDALSKLRAHISPQRFAEAVQHGVEQRLLEQSGFPDFDDWCRAAK
jgi:hypothetical protein